jgi:sec-independent protein translocase protein TatA
MGLGIPELLIILAIALVVFGANKLPGIGDAIGRSIKNFKRASKTDDDDDKEKDALPAGSASRTDRQLDKTASKPASDADGEWEEVVVRRKKKSADS